MNSIFNIRRILPSIVLVAALLPSYGAETEFTYGPNPAGTEYLGYGFGKKEHYDVAIHLADPTLTGCTIVGIRVGIPAENSWISDITAWLSSDLKLENKLNVPDITSVEASMADRMITATFSEPYVLTDEGVYVGYSFTVDELGDYSTSPVAVTEGDAAGGLYLHSSRTRLKWTDESTTSGFVSAMVITLQTESGDYDVSVALPADSYILKNEKENVAITLVNYGKVPLNTVDYTWTDGDDNGGGTVTLPSPLQPGARATLPIEIGPCAKVGTHTLSVTAESFNGQPNGDPRKTSTAKLYVMPFRPVNRPLVEEYTGLRCGYCPRGYVAMEQMTEDFGDRFVGIAYHTQTYESNAMETIANSGFPVDVLGFPYATINRGNGLDPSEVPPLWNDFASITVPAELNVGIEWSENNPGVLVATASLDFVREYSDADFSMAIGLAADGLKNDQWKQSNYFSGESSEQYPGDLWAPFINGGSRVGGLTFNDVVVKFDNLHGIPGSVPAEISLDTHPVCSVEFNINEIVNLAGNPFLTPECKLRAVALLIDNATGAVVNSRKSGAVDNDLSSVGELEEDVAILSTEWFDLTGNRIQVPAHGTPLIRVDRLSNGNVRYTKTMR
ncbi:MAG: hypothetical protein HDS14_01565 [Bacteroides sp.]|nr:hypothetical protein [Bacteroides sp.]